MFYTRLVFISLKNLKLVIKILMFKYAHNYDIYSKRMQKSSIIFFTHFGQLVLVQ